jgi:hypothetical protein
LSASALVWREGMECWMRLGHIAELACALTERTPSAAPPSCAASNDRTDDHGSVPRSTGPLTTMAPQDVETVETSERDDDSDRPTLPFEPAVAAPPPPLAWADDPRATAPDADGVRASRERSPRGKRQVLLGTALLCVAALGVAVTSRAVPGSARTNMRPEITAALGEASLRAAESSEWPTRAGSSPMARSRRELGQRRQRAGQSSR